MPQPEKGTNNGNAASRRPHRRLLRGSCSGDPRRNEAVEDITYSISDGDAVTVDRASSVVYTRRRKAGKKDKGKAVASAVTSSCPPIGRIRTITGKLNLDDNEFDLPEEISVPCRKLKKRRYTMPGRPPDLPQDFVEEQKAYFAEVDAFELPEEYASESDSE